MWALIAWGCCDHIFAAEAIQHEPSATEFDEWFSPPAQQNVAYEKCDAEVLGLGSMEQSGFLHKESLFTWNDEQWVSPAVERDRIVTDRPHLAEATSLVGLGTIQIETGFSYSNDRSSGVRTQAYSIPESLIRAGVIAEWLELRLGWNYGFGSETSQFTSPNRFSGADDMYVGAKVALFKQSGFLPDFTIFPQMNLPTGGSEFTARQPLPGINFAYSWAVSPLLEIECNTVLNRQRDALGLFYLEVFQTVNLEWDVGERWMLFTEYIAFAPTENNAAPFQNYFHYGAHYFITPNFQFDIHSAVGLNSAADNLAFTGVGLSVRF